MDQNGGQKYSFGKFEIDLAQSLLFHENDPVKLSKKTFELLSFFVTHPNEVIEKETLMRELWGDTAVEESNLTVQVSTLRKVLGNGDEPSAVIETFPKVGYRFNAEVASVSSTGRQVISNLDVRSPDSASSFAKQSRRWFWIGAGAIALLSLISVSLLLYRSRDRQYFSNIKIERLTTHGNARGPAVSPDGLMIAYGKQVGDKYSVWLKLVGTTSEKKIVEETEGTYIDATFSPDGKTIYLGIRGPSGGSVVRSMPLLGGSSVDLPLKGAIKVNLSSDGARLSYLENAYSEGRTHLIIANADGSDPKIITTRQAPNYYWTAIKPAWSPDGTKIACVAQNANEATPRLVEIDVTARTERELTPQVWRTMRGVEWMPDMSGLIISAAEEESTILQLWHVSYPDGAATRITNDTSQYRQLSASKDARTFASILVSQPSGIWVADVAANTNGVALTNSRLISAGKADGWDSFEGYNSISWTPDGRIVFGSEEAGNGDIWIMNFDGSDRRPLTTDRRWDTAAVVSPDGKDVVFQSNRSNKESIWIMDIDGNGQRQLTDSMIERRPIFSEDGKWLFFSSWRSGKNSIWKMPIEGGEAQMFSEETAGGQRVAPSGDMILYNLRRETIIARASTGEIIQKFPQPGDEVQFIPGRGAISFIKDTNDVGNIWIMDLHDQIPRQLTFFDSDWVITYGWSRDGKSIAFSRGSMTTDVVVITARD